MARVPYWFQATAFAIIEGIPPLASAVNRWAINRTVTRARARPHPLSTERPYVNWPGLTDKRWSARHLPPDPREPKTAPEDLMPLFQRVDGQQRLCPKSTCLFPAFAQYLTDGFIRTESPNLTPKGEDPDQRLKRNTSNHEIDLCTLYGRTESQTNALRLRGDEEGQKGRLKSQWINGEEFPPFYERDGAPDPAFRDLDPPLVSETLAPEKRAALFAVGGDRVNSVPQTSMINTLLLREHNRLAGEIEAAHPDWDDDRIFETARNTLIVIFIKIVVEDYINHISPLPFNLKADPSVAWDAPWNKPNWITTEFSLLYRWHALIPDQVHWDGATRPMPSLVQDNRPLIDRGLLGAFADISATQAAELGPRNTAEHLLEVEQKSIEQDRFCELASFSDYRDYMGLPRPFSFTDISSDPDVAALLEQSYDHPRDVDFHVGLFCEDRVPNSPLPNLVLRFVALDAFSQALTNPLLSRHVFKRSTFSGPGWRAIENTKTLRDVLDRNVQNGAGDHFIGMARPEWDPE